MFEINNYSLSANRVWLCVHMHGSCKYSTLAYCSGKMAMAEVSVE